MKTSHWMGMLFVGALVAVACGDDDTTSDDDDGTGGTTSSSSSSSGTTSSSSSSSGSQDCGSFQISDEPACQSCLETQCCAQLLACDTGTDCANLIDCANNCDPDDQTCIDGCLTQYQAGQPAYAALFNCLEPAIQGPCADSCASTTICNSELTMESEAAIECINTNCCDSFDPCAEDIDCNACLQDPELTGCDTNTLYAAYNTCMDTNCPWDYCDSGIGLYAGGVDPIYECHLCINASTCCPDIIACVGDQSQTATQMCIDCLNQDSGCTDTTIQGHADAFQACKNNECANECSG